MELQLFNVYATKTKNFYHKEVFVLVAAKDEEHAKKIAKRYWKCHSLDKGEEIKHIRAEATKLISGVIFEY